jgi:hypothetical protein
VPIVLAVGRALLKGLLGGAFSRGALMRAVGLVTAGAVAEHLVDSIVADPPAVVPPGRELVDVRAHADELLSELSNEECIDPTNGANGDGSRMSPDYSYRAAERELDELLAREAASIRPPPKQFQLFHTFQPFQHEV